MYRFIPLALGLLVLVSCSDDTADPQPSGEVDASDTTEGVDLANDSADTGAGNLVFPDELVFGVASAAHQIEGNNNNNNWYQFETLEQYEGATAEPSGLAVNGYELWETDNGLVEATGLDSYRFSIEWSRIMPTRDQFDEDEIAHYRAILEDLRERGISPSVTLHHFTDPIWLNDLSDLDCAAGPSDDNLCGWTNPDAIASYVTYAERMAQEYGDLVDHWTTFNEPNTYSHIGYWIGMFPPGNPGSGGPTLPTDEQWLDYAAPVVRSLIQAHVEAYDVIHLADTVDADSDGESALVGWTVASQYMVPIQADRDQAAADRYRQFLNFVYPDAVHTGQWDPDFDSVVDETHPEWIGRQDFIGVQYYSRMFVLAGSTGMDVVTFIPCMDQLADLIVDCPELDPLNLSFVNEVYPEGLYEVVSEFAERFPGIDLPITENGAAAENGTRKAQILVRHLEQVHRLVQDGFPVTGYYAWSLTDNFEWAHGFEPRFGIYRVNYDTFERTPTRAQEVLAEVAQTRTLTSALLDELAEGPLLADE